MALPLLPVAVSLIAEVVPDLIRIFSGDKAGDVAEKVGSIAKGITGSGDINEAAEMIKADPNLAIKFKEAVLNNKVQLEEISLKREELYVKDVQDARKYRDDKIFWLGIAILVTFGIAVTLILYGSFTLVTGKVVMEQGVLAVVTSFVGTLVGYLAANAQSVVNFFFGSSHGSMTKTDQMGDSIKKFGTHQK